MALTTRRLFVAILFIAIFVMATREIIDPDFWWHLRTGQYILENRAIPRSDIFSATMTGQPWVTHEWLSEVIIYILYSLGSFPALILFFSGIITLSFLLVYARCEGKPYIAGGAVLLGALASAPTWGVRPQMLTLLFATYYLWVLGQDSNQGNRRHLWTLVPVTVLWVNLHSGFALGLVIVATYLVGESIAGWQTSHSLHWTPGTKTLGIVLVLSTLAVLLNPNGARMYVYPFETLGSAAMQKYIQEWFSPDLQQLEFQPFAWLVLAVIGSLALAGKRLTITLSILLVGFAFAALRSARNIPIFAIVAAPIVASTLWSLVPARGWDKTPAASRLAPGLTRLNWIVLVLIGIVAGTRVVGVLQGQSAAERTKFPSAAVDFIASTKDSGTIFNTYGWGGYAIWRLYPRQRVYIDGRADVYGDAFIEDYLKVFRAEDGWSSKMANNNVRWVLVEPNAPLVSALTKDGDWDRAYGDSLAVVFERK